MNVDKDDTTAVATRKEMETKKQGQNDSELHMIPLD